MSIAALITWLLTAVGGFYLLATWIAKGGVRPPRTSHLPATVVFAHVVLAVAGLIVWIVYLVTGAAGLAWASLVILLVIAVLGFTMLLRWIPTYRSRTPVAASGPGISAGAGPAERHFPVAVVGGHGLFAVVTVVLVLLTAAGVGG